MTPAAPTLRAACVTALTTGAGATALESAGVADADAGGVIAGGVPEPPPALPYVEVQGAIETEGIRTTATRSTEATVTFVCRASTLAVAEALASVVVDYCGKRLTVSGFDVVQATLDLYGPWFREDPPGARAFTLPVRIRHLLYQTAPASE